MLGGEQKYTNTQGEDIEFLDVGGKKISE